MSLDFNSKKSSTILLDDRKLCQDRAFDAHQMRQSSARDAALDV
jgi:hypothetical protein